jgi:hypothetical protein
MLIHGAQASGLWKPVEVSGSPWDIIYDSYMQLQALDVSWSNLRESKD